MKERFVKTHQPCPCGMSSDAYSVRKDGSGYCFSCGESKNNKKEEIILSDDSENNEDEVILQPKGKETYEFISRRGVSDKTREKMGVFTKLIDGVPFSTLYTYPNSSGKVRVFSKDGKDRFVTQGDYAGAHLFLEDRFPPGSRDTVTITEGEEDALSLVEILGDRHAAVSVRNAVTAFGDIKARREYLNSFKKIILFLDADKHGQEAERLVVRSGLFDYEKLYTVSGDRLRKDANDYLQNGEREELYKTWNTARKYSPDSIINSFKDIRDALGKKRDAPIIAYPFSNLSENLFGIHRSEMILFKGLEGIGKTEWCRALLDKILRETDEKVATIFLEEDEGTTIKGVATYELKQPCANPLLNMSDADIMKGYERALKGDDSRLYIHKHFTGDDESELLDNIRFLRTVAGCSVILLDNLTMLTTGRGDEDERLRIDRITRRLRDLVSELGICLVLVAHVNDNGQTRGSRLPDKLANTVIHGYRDVLAPSVQQRNVLRFMVEKARISGTQTGEAGAAYFDPVSYTLRDIQPADEVILPPLNFSS